MNNSLTQDIIDFSQHLIEFSKSLSILYVEDNKEVREASLDMLSDIFGTIDVAFDGVDGLEKFSQNTYDMIITDINMPNMDGIEMISNIRKQDKNIVILVVSAYSESGYFTETIRLGVEGYLLKPIEFEQFIQIISKAVEKIQLRKENEAYRKSLEDRNQSLIKDLDVKNDEILKIIYQDNLTMLPNRNALDLDIKALKGELLELLLIDIDNFKNFNSLYGIDTGDKILIQFANKLNDFAKEHDYKAYRISADEFVLLNSTSIFHEKINTVLETFDKSQLTINNKTIDLHITIGVALDFENLLSKASMALDSAKKKNKKVILFNKELNPMTDVKNIFYWQKEIEDALDENRIVPFFQPIFDKDKNIVKYESLMRMKQYDGDKVKYISPVHFLDIAIKTKQYEELSMTMIKKVLDVMRLNRNITVSINLGYRDIKSNHVKEVIQNFIKQTKAMGSNCKLIFEVVESEDIEDYKLIKDFFDEFNCGSIEIAIDDFGSGYSNFNQILQIMPNYLKIDGSLIKDIAFDTKAFILVKAIISFAKELNIKTIAEFVHNEEIFEILKNEGVDEFQGFFLGEPAANN